MAQYWFMLAVAMTVCSAQLNERCYHEGSVLEISDFKGTAPTKTNVVAITVSSIQCEYLFCDEYEAKLRISNCFDKNLSWWSAKRDTIRVLNHEQRHWDITEIHARRLRQKLKNIQLTFEERNESIRDLHKRAMAEADEMQKLYDLETDHYNNFEMQTRWDRKIDSMLQELDEWKDEELEIEFL